MSTKKKVTIVPRGAQILVRVVDAEPRETSRGLLIPDEVEQERKSQGTVVAVGPDVKDVKKGEKVVYGTFAGEALKIREDEKQVEYKLLDDADVIAFIR
jgi:chaperonin GroES